MTENRLEYFFKAIGYPERPGDAVSSFTMRVDGMEVQAEDAGGRIILSYALSGEDSDIPALAAYAAGRMLREDAVVAYGRHSTFLWQDAPADADARGLVRLFETFMDSCDWWRDRVNALRGGEAGAASVGEDMVIMP